MRRRPAAFMTGVILLSATFGMAIAALALVFLGGNVQPQSFRSVEQRTGVTSTKASLPADDAKIASILKVFSQMGESTCLRKIEKTVRFFGLEKEAAGIIIPRADGSDKGIISLVMPARAIAGTGVVSADFSSQLDQSCDGTYEAIDYWNEPCGPTIAAHFRDLKVMTSAKNGFSALGGPNGVYVFVLPAGPGCLTVKKERIG